MFYYTKDDETTTISALVPSLPPSGEGENKIEIEIGIAGKKLAEADEITLTVNPMNDPLELNPGDNTFIYKD